MLDITTSLKTALFFACCKADKNGLDWHPLTKADFERVDSRRNVAALGGDSRYAVLHYVPTNIVDCQWVSMDEENTNGVITPIGYQPFMLAMDKRQNYMTVPAALRELEKIEMVRLTDTKYHLDHAVTATQKALNRRSSRKSRRL